MPDTAVHVVCWAKCRFNNKNKGLELEQRFCIVSLSQDMSMCYRLFSYHPYDFSFQIIIGYGDPYDFSFLIRIFACILLTIASYIVE